MIQQNNMEFYYGFEPKAVQILHKINWDMGLCVSYGDPWVGSLYRYKSYVIGVPYFALREYKDSYLS
jgi:hypothetical protein